MNTSRLLKVISEFHSSGLDDISMHYDNLVKSLFTLFHYRNKANPYHSSERLYHVNLLTQKMMFHSHAAREILKGYNVDLPYAKMHIYDPFSVFVLHRAILENFLTLNYLTRSTGNEEAEVRFQIWMMYGLSQRNCNDIESEEASYVQECDLHSIKECIDVIKKSNLYYILDESKKETLFKAIKNDWKIIFNESSFYAAPWKKLLEFTGINENIRSDMYNFLSWHSHSQSISTLQLAIMYNDERMDIVNTRLSTKELSMLVAFLINDLLFIDNTYIAAYDQLSDKQKEIITFYNNTFRDKKYAFDKIE